MRLRLRESLGRYFNLLLKLEYVLSITLNDKSKMTWDSDYTSIKFGPHVALAITIADTKFQGSGYTDSQVRAFTKIIIDQFCFRVYGGPRQGRENEAQRVRHAAV